MSKEEKYIMERQKNDYSIMIVVFFVGLIIMGIGVGTAIKIKDTECYNSPHISIIDIGMVLLTLIGLILCFISPLFIEEEEIEEEIKLKKKLK